MSKTRNLRENSEMLKTKAHDLSNDNELKSMINQIKQDKRTSQGKSSKKIKNGSASKRLSHRDESIE